jgi:hypothetical protein
MVSPIKVSKGLGALGVVSVLVSTVGMAIGGAEPAFSQQRVCVETNAGQIVCGRVVDEYSGRFDRDRWNNNDRDRWNDNRHDRDRWNDDRRDRDRDSSTTCSITGFDEAFYRLAYQDVEAAIRQGRVKSACDHYRVSGRYEGRFPRFNEASYLAKNPDVANAVRLRQFRSAYEHWQKYGRFENRPL